MPAQYRPLADEVPPVTASEYRGALARLGLNNTAAGELFGISAVTSRRFSGGTQAVPGPLGRLVRLIEAQRLTVDQLRTWFEPAEGTTR